MKPLPSKQNNKCVCELCEGKYIQVDPVDCGCTECITKEYRPAVSKEDYDAHNGDLSTNMTTLTSQEEIDDIAEKYGMRPDGIRRIKQVIAHIKHTATIQGARKYQNIINKGKCNNEDVLFIREVNDYENE